MSDLRGRHVTVIGGGCMGANVAIFLARIGASVTLVERECHILTGAPQVTFLLHADGFEYYKKNHRATGKHCIQGALTKTLLYPRDAFVTDVTSALKPVRFLVSKDTAAAHKDRISQKGFYDNALYNEQFFSHSIQAVANTAGLSDSDLCSLLGRLPTQFAQTLGKDDWHDVSDIAFGVAGVSEGANMAHYYALLLALLHDNEVKLKFDAHLTRIRNLPNNRRQCCFKDGTAFQTDYVVIAASAGTPGIIPLIDDALPSALPRGMYYRNAMALTRLPARNDAQYLYDVSRITFVLQGEHGSAFTCIVPPTATTDGIGAMYCPHEKGSQLRHWASNEPEPRTIPRQEHETRGAILDQGRRFYRVAQYAEIYDLRQAVVFAASEPGTKQGMDRKVRPIARKVDVTLDRRVVSYHAPKATNAELVALMAADDALATLSGIRLEQLGTSSSAKDRTKYCLYGPTKINVPRITRFLHFRDASKIAKVVDAVDFAQRSYGDSRIVRPQSHIFAS